MQRFSRIPAARGAVALAVVLSMLVTAIGNVDFPEPSKRAVAQDEPVPSGDVIVILDDDAASAADVHAEATEDGVDPTVVFSTVVDGYAATVTQEQAADLAADPDVAAIYPDNPVYQASQTIPSGVKRIGADSNDVANINGVDQRVDADVALIDSGVDPNTGDLNVAGGTDCVGAGTYADQSGHGTHVAGTIAALDNNIGVVGVAPGARIWSVRALNGSGVGSDSTLICGLDWVYAHRATIDVVNMSVVGSGDDIACTRSGPPNDGSVPYSPMHEAVCKLYDAGIPIVAAAGNNKMNASNVTPATFGEVIAVSAFADYDGKPGGTGAKPLGCGQSTLDDRFYATSTIGSNFGPDVDIMAPGVCVQSTAMGGGTAMRTGTSMAAPHVTGAIALYLSQNSSANVEAVKDWLYGLAVPQDAPGGILGGDPDGISEPVLKVSLGGIPLATLTPTPTPTGTVVAPKNAYKLTKSGASGGASNYVRDNNLGTVWATRSNTPPNAFVWVQLAQSSPIGSIRWIMGETGFADRYWIETSNDLVTWTRIAKRGNKPVGVWNEVMPTGVSAKYVRFRYDNPYGDRHLGGIAEIQVWAPGAPSVNPSVTPTAGPPPVKYAIASTKQSLNSKNGIKVLDGNASTYWITNTSASPPSSAVLQLSLGTTKFVGAVRWMFGLEGKADVVKIETSTNEVTWTTVAIRTNASLYQWQEFTVNQNAKFVRFKVENPNGDVTIGGIAEAEIWSAAGGPLTNVTLPTTPTPAATQTSIPTVTSTVEGQNAPTDTPTATASATLKPTQTPTPAATSTDIPLPTATDTSVPTATPTPTETPTDHVVQSDAADQAATEQAVDDPTVAAEQQGPYEPSRLRGSGNASGIEFLLDSDPSTYWATDSAGTPRNAWVVFDLGSVQPVGSVRWLFAVPGIADQYVVDVSTDGQGWTPVFEGGFPEAGVWQKIDLGLDARFVRITIDNPNRLPQIGGLAEVEIWP